MRVCLCLLIVTGASFAQAPGLKLEIDTWEAVYARDLQGRDQQIGYSHLTVEKLAFGGAVLNRANRELRIAVKRSGQVAQLKMDEGSDETGDGKLQSILTRHWQGQQQVMTIRGTVDADSIITLRADGAAKDEKQYRLPEGVRGIYGERAMLAQKKAKPGDTFSYKLYVSSLRTVVTINVTVEKLEMVDVPKLGKMQLLHVESEMEPVEGVQLPGSTLYVDPTTYEPVMTQTMMPELGLLTFVRTTQASATGPLGNIPDMSQLMAIRLPASVSKIHDLATVTWRITARGKADAKKLLPEDDHQIALKADGKQLDLQTRAIRTVQPIANAPIAAEEYRVSNHFINSDDALVRTLAKRAIGTETEPWKQAQAIERFVRTYIDEVTYSESLATADETAKSKKGDCTEFSMLAAAMCRAAGVPSRTAIGLVYVEGGGFGGPVLAFHMWFEVYISGRWLALDATLGRGSVGPGHIKITDHSWYEQRSFKPLLPVMGFIMARPLVEATAVSER